MYLILPSVAPSSTDGNESVHVKIMFVGSHGNGGSIIKCRVLLLSSALARCVPLLHTRLPSTFQQIGPS